MRILIIIIWFFLLWFYWKCQNSCCENFSEPVSEVIGLEPIKPIVRKLTPIGFKCNDAQPNVEPTWKRYRDSIIAQLDDDEVLNIEGKFFLDEVSSNKENLGLQRAKNVLKLFENLNDDKVTLTAQEKGDSCLHSELNNLIAFRFLRNSKKIVETPDLTTIFFEYNSIDKLNDNEVEAYLDQVLTRLSASSEKVKLIGHTDSDGTYDYNFKLGENRATVIADYLIKKGLNPNRIIVDSRGELEPLQSNKTPAGMAKNRRTDLIIFE